MISGPAALVCAETLRQNCYEGRIVMVTRDTLPPFDKPKLSKVRRAKYVHVIVCDHCHSGVRIFSLK